MAYIGSRSSRYADAMDIESDWTREALTDIDMVALEPDPKFGVGASRFLGHSPSAGRLLVVIAYHDLDRQLHAGTLTGHWADLQIYQEGLDDGQDS